ncbi:hypothetical protein BDR26DRAFT_866841 [Obelidium mucronatum]|nr:hypothetical protein BDR26DRAFT_866841 [Obelidium mucronatum]
MEEILLKADFHPDLLKELHQIETKHDTYSLLALSKLEFSRSSAIETCLACSKMANDTFLDKRKQARALLSESLVWGAHGIQFEYLSGGRGGSGDSGGVVSGVVGSLSGGGGGLEASVPPLARRGKRKEMHDAIFRSSSVGANGFPDWIRQSVLKKKGRRNTAVSNGRRSSSHSGNNSSAGAVVPPTCDGLGRADVEDDIALLRVLTSAT